MTRASKYLVLADLKTIALYYAWEYGFAKANTMLRELRKWRTTVNIAVEVPFEVESRAQALQAMARVEQAAAFQWGRIGRRTWQSPLTSIIRYGAEPC